MYLEKSQVQLGLVKSGQVKLGQVKTGEEKAGGANSGQVKSGQLKSSQVKSELKKWGAQGACSWNTQGFSQEHMRQEPIEKVFESLFFHFKWLHI